MELFKKQHIWANEGGRPGEVTDVSGEEGSVKKKRVRQSYGKCLKVNRRGL